MTATPQTETAPTATAALPRVIFLLCTYNEVENLPEMFQQLAAALPLADVLVVDDNSPDGTAGVVRAQAEFRRGVTFDPGVGGSQLEQASPTPDDARPRGIYLLLRERKQGLGTATRTGLQWCLRQGYDFIINLDADLSHNPQVAPRLLAACLDAQTACDVAVGSRYVAGGSMPGLAPHRRWISRGLNTYATRLLGLPVRDCSGSYRCYRAAALAKLDFQQLICPGYGFLEEILVALYRNGAKLTEVPIEFRSRSQGHSKLGLRDAWGALSVIHRLAWRRSREGIAE